jgi:O-antigen/teichoic acid export membrane protein
LGAIWFRELRLLAADSPEFKSRLTQMGLMLLGAALTILALGMVFKTRILHFTFGADYASAAELLPWLLAALIFVLPNTVLTQAAIAKNRERLYAVAAGIGALLNIGLNWMLIPQFGGLGAAWSTIATEGILGVFLLWGLWRRADKGGEV